MFSAPIKIVSIPRRNINAGACQLVPAVCQVLFLLFLIPVLSCSGPLFGSDDESGSSALTSTGEQKSEVKKETDSPSPESDRRDFQDIFDDYQKRLQNIIDKCSELGMQIEQQITHQLLWKTDSYGFQTLNFGRTPMPDELPDDAQSRQKSWYRALLKRRVTSANELFQLAKESASNRRGYDALRLTLATLYINPDHAEARRIFNFSLVNDRWMTDWEQKQIQRGYIDHPQLGWIKKADVPKYEKGLRPFRGNWISLEEDRARVKSVLTGWRVETEHYILYTSHSQEEGVRLCRRLEDFYQSWRQLFYRFIASDQQWVSIFNGTGKLSTRRHKIYFFRNRQEYLSELRRHDENIEYSHGGYFPGQGCMYVYAPGPGEDIDLDVMICHESTHQLFQECRPATSGKSRKKNRSLPGRQSNFWITEAIATYMETFRSCNNNYCVGGANSLRFQRARERCNEPGGYLALRDYTALSLEEFQSNPALLPMYYTQAAGLATFFLHADNGKYRNAFIACLYLVYEEMDTATILERLTGRTFEQLDVEYQEYMRSSPEITSGLN